MTPRTQFVVRYFEGKIDCDEKLAHRNYYNSLSLAQI